MTRVISVVNQKGGTGKTTTAVNLAAYLAKLGKKVLLIDIDPQGNATSGCGIDKRTCGEGTYGVLSGSISLGEGVVRCAGTGIDLLPANNDLAASEIELPSAGGDWQRALADAIALADLRHDYVFIDCPPSLGVLFLNALTASDRALIVTQCEYFSLEGLSDLADNLKRLRNAYNEGLKLAGVLRTMHDPRNLLTRQISDELEKHFGETLFRTTIPRNVRLAEAPSHGQSIMEYDGACRGALAYRSLAQELLERRP